MVGVLHVGLVPADGLAGQWNAGAFPGAEDSVHVEAVVLQEWVVERPDAPGSA